MWQNFKNGFIKENPVFALFLGMCSALAISTSLNNAIGMGVCVTLVLLFSNVIISLLRKLIPDEIRIPVYIVVIASLVTIVEMLVHAYAPALYQSLGVFLSLPLLFLYNGTQGCTHPAWIFFYRLFYPFHLSFLLLLEKLFQA